MFLLWAQLQVTVCDDKEIKSKKVHTQKMKRITLLIVLFASLTVAGKFHALLQWERSRKTYDYWLLST